MSTRAHRMTAVAMTRTPSQKSHRPASFTSCIGPSKAIAEARLCDDDSRSRRIALDLPSEMRDVDAQILLRIAECTTPHRVEDLLMARRTRRVRREGAQDCPLRSRQLDLVCTTADGPFGEI